MNQSNLTPQQQDALFTLAKRLGLQPANADAQTQTPDGGSAMGDSSAQSQVPPDLQNQMFQQSQQNGGQPSGPDSQTLDPFHVAASLALQAHTQPELTGVRPQIPGNGLGSMLSKLFTGHPLMHAGDPIMATNTVPNQGSLPPGMQLQPIGQDSSGKPLFDYGAAQKQQGYESQLAAAMARTGITNPTFNKQQLLANNVPEDDANRLVAANPNGVSLKALSDYRSGQKNATGQAMVEARNDMVDVMNKRLIAMTEGPEALQAGMKDASQRSNNILRFNGVYKTIQDQGFTASKLQRSLLNTEVARVIVGSGGVLTDEGFSRVASDTAQSKIGDWKQWLLNEATPVEFKAFADQAKQLMDNEFVANQKIFQAGQQMSAKILQNPSPAPYQSPQSISGVSMPPASDPRAALQPLAGKSGRKPLSSIFGGR